MKYKAFISYRHKPDDEKWAKWLQEAIETFSTPKELVLKGIPPNLGKVFLDDSEMAATSELSQTIKEALWESEWLIVIASLDTPQSDWVRQEINLFRNAWKRKDKVLALLISGTPSQSYPPELRELRTIGEGPNTVTEYAEPAGACVTEIQNKIESELKALALDKFAAALLNCEFGELRDRVKERMERVTTVRYYHTYVERRGIPEGRGEIDSDTQKQRGKTYAFHSRDEKVRKVELINGLGFPVHDDQGVCRWDISYRSEGSVVSINSRDINDNIILRKAFNEDASVVDFYQKDQHSVALPGFSFDMGFSQKSERIHKNSKTTITRHLIGYNKDGYCICKKYCKDGFNTPTSDILGCFGEKYEIGENGVITDISFIDENGTSITLKNGISKKVFTYGTIYEELSHAYIFNSESPNSAINPSFTISEDGVSQSVFKYNSIGNRIEESYFGTDGKPTLHKDGYARFTSSYDQRGNRIEQACFDVKGKPALIKDGISVVKSVFDERGRKVSLTYYGLTGERTNGYRESAEVRNEWSARGQRLSRRYYGLNSEAINCSAGYHKVVFERNRFGDCIAKRFYTNDGMEIPYPKDEDEQPDN